MPYLTADRKAEIDKGVTPKNEGELNYALTRQITRYLRAKARANRVGYAELNEVKGAMTGALLEFYRRVVAPYEDGKIDKNGDVYDELLDVMGLLGVRPFRGPEDDDIQPPTYRG